MDFSTALQKLEDRISGLNTMRGRLVKFVNPQTPPATSAPEVTTPAPLSDSERQERLNLINRLIVTRNITNDDLAPLGLHFENIEVFRGVVWRNNELTQAFKDYMRSMDSISAFGVIYGAMKPTEFRKLDFTMRKTSTLSKLYFLHTSKTAIVLSSTLPYR
ncbi:hypothetical protein [Helicobacter suis]|uniref:Uncharacterized protein n=1 Tax=Helicobacter suis TaxID=104628 RepID=A0ABM7KZA7_9HELI|nr:hypothetical protein [Helicobacter suis]BCD45810.1 hypothetical protein NHP190020_08490 [Helicobacter suis]BCD50022.1 hypothetical protein NHP194004_14690 [Helicobacter suis]